MSFRHTWVNPLIVILVVLSGYFVSPGKHNPLHSALFLSYADPPWNERTNTIPAHVGNVTQYGKGPKDFAFVAFYTVVLTFTREFLMQQMIRPIGIWCGIRARGKLSRFMEQFYTAIYFGVAGPLGFWVMSRTPVWYFNTVGMYEGYPHRAHEALFKAYYLLQASYWMQQALVLMLQLEKPRKDFKELVLHHIITLALIWCSYRFHFTYIGVAVYVTHDISDFFIATSKIFNYLDFWITGPYFVMFLCIWAYLRHYINLLVLKTLISPGRIPYTNIRTGEFATVGPYELNWELQQYKSSVSQPMVFLLLASLQTINIIWFFLLVRIALRYLIKGEQKDERSEDEAEEEEMPEPRMGNGLAANGNVVKPVAVE
ncbi:sphingosine N-acyltransferase lag1 [Friedmanniomyces endolithicus]|nr:sphingosine N-acyltransferase lag1 [Friedmanniomyces endolithicus]